METPVFSTIGMPSATLDFTHAFVLTPGSTARIEISLNGGTSYLPTPLMQWNGSASVGVPLNNWTPLSINLSSYLGQPNLRIRFVSDFVNGPTLSTWAIDGIGFPAAAPPVTYIWTPTGTGTSTGGPIPVSPATTTTYTLTSYIGSCYGGQDNVTVTVNQRASIAPASVTPTFCVSPVSQSYNLAYTNATNSPNRYTILWNGAPANGFVNVIDAVLSPSGGNGIISLTIPANAPAGNYTGVLSVKNAFGCAGPGSPISIQVNPLPVAPTAIPATICDPGPATIGATPTNGSTVDWYTLPTGGTAIATGTTTYAITNLTVTTTYYAQSRNTTTGCISPNRTAVVATVNASGAVTANPVTNPIGCIGSSATITGSGTGTGVNYEWEINMGSGWGPLAINGIYSIPVGNPGNVLNISSVSIDMANYLYRLKLTTPPPCNTVARSQEIHIIIRNVWMGYVNRDWNNGANWSDGNVASYVCDDVHILNQDNDPILNSVGAPTPPITNLRIYPGADLTLTNGSVNIPPMTGAKLRVRGHIYKDPSATFNAKTGTLEMIGGDGGYAGAPGAQTIDANTFNNNALGNLIVNNTGTLTLNGDVDIYESVEYGSVGSSFATNDFLTLKSMPALTARMGVLTGKTINGQVTVERYLPAKAAWRFLAVPTHSSGQTIHQAWQENRAPLDPTPAGYGTNIEGPTFPGGGYDAFSQRPAMKSFDPAALDGYTGIANTSIPISNPLGYMVFVRGDRSVINGQGSTTLRTKGLLYKGPLSFNIDPAVGFNSVGNPYASRIDLRNIAKSSEYVDAFTVWNPDLAGLYGVGGYETLVYQTSGPDAGNYKNNVSDAVMNNIESGQAFYIQTNNTTGLPVTMNFTENLKTVGSANVSFAPNGEPEVSLNMKLVSKPGNQPDYNADGILMTFSTGYSRVVDNYDVKKLFNNADNLAVFSGDNYLVAERTDLPDHGDTIHLFLYATRQQDYRFDFEPFDLQKLKVQPYLYDGYLQTYLPIELNRKSFVNFNITADAASKAGDRFKIVFRKLQRKNIVIRDLQAGRKQDRTIGIDWKVENEADVKQYEIERSADGVLFTGIITLDATGNNNTTVAYTQTDIGPLSKDNYYRVKATQNDGAIVYSAVVKVAAEPDPATPAERDIRVFPNPVTGKRLQLLFTNQPAGIYQVQLLNQLGQVIQLNTVTVYSGNQKQVIQLGSSVSAGRYQINIFAPDGKKTQQSLFIE
jgi:hypothetical protein